MANACKAASGWSTIIWCTKMGSLLWTNSLWISDLIRLGTHCGPAPFRQHFDAGAARVHEQLPQRQQLVLPQIADQFFELARRDVGLDGLLEDLPDFLLVH